MKEKQKMETQQNEKERPISTHPFHHVTTPWSAEAHQVSYPGEERSNP